jgi:transcriptional regulator with XRE-family HTH domain
MVRNAYPESEFPLALKRAGKVGYAETACRGEGLPVAKKKVERGARKKSRRGPYTEYGDRIAALGVQREIAKVLGRAEQTLSKKLRGECAIFLSDLEKLSEKFKKPMRYFVECVPRSSTAGLREEQLMAKKKGTKRQKTAQLDTVERVRWHEPYTLYGERISALGRQIVIAKVLGVSQQTVSKKQLGKLAILLSDLEKLSKKFKVPMTYFVE